MIFRTFSLSLRRDVSRSEPAGLSPVLARSSAPGRWEKFLNLRAWVVALALVVGWADAGWAAESPAVVVSTAENDRVLSPAPKIPSAEAEAQPLEPVAAGPATHFPAGAGRLRLTTKPAGVAFEVLASAYETPNAKVLRSGRTPVTIQNLAPGAYRVRFTSPGLPPRSASVQVTAREETLFEHEFPHGLLKVRSQPAGAEIFCDGRLVGLTPAALPIPPGKHQIRARWKKRMARPKTVRIAVDRSQLVAFDFTPSAPPRPKPTPLPEKEKTLWEKVAGSVKDLVTETGHRLSQ